VTGRTLPDLTLEWRCSIQHIEPHAMTTPVQNIARITGPAFAESRGLVAFAKRGSSTRYVAHELGKSRSALCGALASAGDR
jgi:hypothetical protein